VDIIDFKKQKFIRDSIEFLKSNKATLELKEVIATASPSYIDYLKKGESEDTKKVIDATINKVKQRSQKEITANRQKINIVALSTLESMATDSTKFHIPEVVERYRETINPVKALYYDLQEIMFLYNGKPKNKHHKFLIEKFSDKKSFEEILFAVDRDLEDLNECKNRINGLRKELGFSNRSEYHKKILDMYTEMKQWKRLFAKFPEWVDENYIKEESGSLIKTLKNFFS
tara:strand:+ start:10701 stop:11390 length:690 start_codon:yes stop_codon:yes gene_type:complete